MELIEKVKLGLDCCKEDVMDMQGKCLDCPYFDYSLTSDCTGKLAGDALAVLSQLVREKAVFMEHAKGYCGLCKHDSCSPSEEPCESCFDPTCKQHGSNWEWIGVEGDD